MKNYLKGEQINQTPSLDINNDPVSLSLQQRILDSVIDYAPIALSVVAGALGVGLLLWYFRRGSDPDRPSLADSKPKNPPIVSTENQSETIANQRPEESLANRKLTQHVVHAFERYSKGHARRIYRFRNDQDPLTKHESEEQYRFLVGGNRIIGDIREGEYSLNLLIKQCDKIVDPMPVVVRFSRFGVERNNVVNVHFQKMFRQQSYLPEEQLFERLLTPGDLPNKARSILTMLNDPNHTKRILKALDVLSKGWKQSAGEDWPLYPELMKFLEFARARALSGHVPPKLRDCQLEWAMIDLEVRVENWDRFVTTRPEAQEENFIKENILQLSSPTSEQIIEKYELYKTSWGLPNLSLADIQPYVESLARNYSTALERYANAEEDDLIRSTALEHIGTAETTPASEAIAGSSMQFSANQNNQSQPASSATVASGLQQGGSERAKQDTGVPPTGASSSKAGSSFVGSPFEQSIKNELSAFIAFFEYHSIELAAPTFLCMLVLLALVLPSKDRIVALLAPLFRLAKSLQTLQWSHWKAFVARLKSLFKLWRK